MAAPVISMRWRVCIQRHARLFAVLESLDNGKTIRETRDLDVPLAARHFYYHAGWAQLQECEFADYQPVGVVGQVIPWNFPLLMLAWKTRAGAGARQHGGAEARRIHLAFSAALRRTGRAGRPAAGCAQYRDRRRRHGRRSCQKQGCRQDRLHRIDRGRPSHPQETAGTGKSLTLELGGKSPFIVFDDADIDGAIEGVVDAIWFNQGQVCCAGSRLLVQEGIAETFRKRLIRRMETLRVGNPLDKAMDMGAIVDKVQLERIASLVKQGIAEGAQCYQSPGATTDKGFFYPPTLLTNVHPASTVAREEIFGPVLVTMTFRTPDEAVMLANNTRYGLAASVWSETIGLALDIAPKLQAGVVWVNSTNLFDASAGFGGYRESGFGREGGREGAYEYLKLKAWAKRKARAVAKPLPAAKAKADAGLPMIDRTAKLFVGGKQARPDGNYSRPALSPKGEILGEVGEGNRKDIRNAVAAARGAEAWSKATAHNRAQILYYIAENLSGRRAEFTNRIAAMTGARTAMAQAEVDAAIKRLFTYGAWADKFEGDIHTPPLRGLALALKEPIGVAGVVCPDEAPLLGFISLVAPLIAMGNRVVAVPSERHPLAATDFYTVLETSDVPAGVVNIVTGDRLSLTKTLAEHDDVDALWVFGSDKASAEAERLSSSNLKRTLVDHGLATDWFDPAQAEGPVFLRQATQVKNVWIPYGE
jgi:aldehyde dehydrogenase (NAD+)